MPYTAEARPAQDVACRRCPSWNVNYQVWESSCAAYEDYHFTCNECPHDWWIDGPDA